ncbi:haloacid dehalogenase [Serinibacter arcticus]|uniref:Haloacid dehalogenase n=1 Tax=Serinibacter arcticus TaxID=1655435 RepID=A0A2U1ZVH5_9MICO|nr:HAD family hydrolase [Serinibacter arcticus]PWD50995.1 haloacid dehalogenase [Serinibacter arcticus]
MTPRAIFLDVDGTLAQHGVVPPGNLGAVRAARAAGHRVLLATGRPRSMISDLVDLGFDGAVASAGGYVEIDGDVLEDGTLPPELTARAVRALLAHDVAFLLEGSHALAGPAHGIERLVEALTHVVPPGGLPPIAALTEEVELAAFPTSKISYFASPVTPEQLLAEIGAGIAVIPSSIPELGEGAGELYRAGLSKADGLARAAGALGVAQADVIAVGDGPNDVEMLAWAGLGVGVTGSHPAVLAVADALAGGPEVSGLAELFARLGLLD